MCFGGGPSKAEKQAAAEQRVEADVAKQEEIQRYLPPGFISIVIPGTVRF